MRSLIRLPYARTKSFCALIASGAMVLACSDSGSPDGSGGAGGANTGGATATGGAGGTAGRDSSAGAGGSGLNDASGGATGTGGTVGDASGTSDARADARDAMGGAGGGVRDASSDGGGIADASDETAGPRDSAGGTGGAGGSGGATDGASGGVADAKAETDGTIADASVETDGTSVDASSGVDRSTDPDGGDTTSIVAAGVRWMGRVDTSNASAPRFSWGTAFAARFSGASVGIDLQNEDTYFFQVVVDGQKGERFQADKGRAKRVVASGLAAGSHTLEVYRETEAYYGTTQFFGITEATLEPPPASRGRLLEFVGDSITAGYGNLGSEPHINAGVASPCSFSFATESVFMSYGAVAARALGADASILAESGWGVYRDRTGSTTAVLPKVYDRTLANDETPKWDFRTKPQAVIINLGTNDFAPGDPGNAYTMALGAFVDTVRSYYPSAWIFLAVGTMYTNAEHTQALAYTQSAVASRGGDASKVAAVDLGSQDETKGTGCDWHPSAVEHQRMADVLVPVLKQKLGW